MNPHAADESVVDEMNLKLRQADCNESWRAFDLTARERRFLVEKLIFSGDPLAVVILEAYRLGYYRGREGGPK